MVAVVFWSVGTCLAATVLCGGMLQGDVVTSLLSCSGKFQQFVEFFVPPSSVPRLEWWTFRAACRSCYRTVHTLQQTVEISQVHFLGWFWTRPFLCNNRCLGWGRAMVCSTMDTCYASSRVAFWKNFLIFYRKEVDSAPELDSRPALLLMLPAHLSTTASGMFHAGFAGVDAPRAVFP